MPIVYSVQAAGHLIQAIASGVVTGDELVAYELAHTADPRIALPLGEILEIQHGVGAQLSRPDLERVVACRRTPGQPPVPPHRCAIVVSVSDAPGWELAKLYEAMALRQRPEPVIVFADRRTAETWLGLPPAPA
jgi:hypothetical protein